MKNLFDDNRPRGILSLLRKSSSQDLSELARSFSVSQRTIRNDVASLNQELGSRGLIEIVNGACRLRIFDAEGFRATYARIMRTDDLMNSPRRRREYLFAKLLRAVEPISTDEIAYELNIGHTTFVGDLRRLRDELGGYELAVVGLSSKGLMLSGSEFNIRRYVMERVYEVVYRDYPVDASISAAVERAFTHCQFEQDVRQRIVEYLTLMLDRFLTGHYIGPLPEKYYPLAARAGFSFVDQLVNHIGNMLQVEFPIEEKLFVLLPIISMRAPMKGDGLYDIELDGMVRGLLDEIVQRIHDEFSLSLDVGEFRPQFLRHLTFMINRLRYGIAIDNPLMGQVEKKYPLAKSMARVAADVVERRCGVTVTPEELAFLAAYFGVFLEMNDQVHGPRRVAIVCENDRVDAWLITAQVRRVVDSSTRIEVIEAGDVTPERLDGYDVVLSAVDLPFDCTRPVIYVSEVVDEKSLKVRLSKAKYWRDDDSVVLDGNQLVLASFVDEGSFFTLDGAGGYEDAVRLMATTMAHDGYADEGFADRLEERERRGTMVFENGVAIPHAAQSERGMLSVAVGVFHEPVEYHGHKIALVFLLALPDGESRSDNLLVRVYDEIMRIAAAPARIADLAQADSYVELMTRLY